MYWLAGQLGGGCIPKQPKLLNRGKCANSVLVILIGGLISHVYLVLSWGISYYLSAALLVQLIP